jgi:hypothetical protein
MTRLSRESIVTEKIDGTNAQVCITEDGDIFAGSRTRWITPQDDNYGFAAWVEAHRNELLGLGPGHHFGEWWGLGIQRNYGMKEKVFSLFNVARWGESRPECCRVVPTLAVGLFDDHDYDFILHGKLALEGSVAAPGFMKPEGIVVFHTAANICFKKTIDKDDQPKGLRT